MSIEKVLRIARALALAVVAAMSVSSWAECRYSPRMQFGEYRVDFGKIVVDNRLPLNAVVASRRIPLGGAAWHWIAECTPGGAALLITFRGTKGELLPDLMYSTNVPGLAYRMQVEGDTGKPAFPTTHSAYPPRPGENNTSVYQSWTTIRIDLIKTATRVGNGPLDIGLYGEVFANPNPNDFYIRLFVTGGTILSPSCTVAEKSRDFTVQMDRVPTSEFNGVGSTAREKPFSVDVDCKAAPGNIQSTVSMTMHAARATAQPGVMDINPVGPTHVIAGGVGIQVLDAQRQPVEFGKAATVGMSRDFTYSVPFIARYMQTGGELKPGIANGTATVTLTHQ